MKTAHLLAGFIAFLIVADQFLIFRLKRAPEPRARLRTYQLITAGEWLAALWAATIMGPQALWSVALSTSASRWLPQRWIVAVMAIVSVLAVLTPLMVARRRTTAAVIARGLDRMRFMLPQTPTERLWWGILSLTAGICEECIFRSFLFWYFQNSPWHLSLVTAVCVACLIFAMGHLYQGLLAAFATGVLALLLFVLFLGSGNLLLPIALHAIADLRVLFLLPRAQRPELAEN